MRLVFSFARDWTLSFISHLDLVRLFLRAFSRSSLPLAYSQGFNPHPRFALALPLPLGVTASGEYGEVSLTENIDPSRFVEILRNQLPEGLRVTGAREAKPDLPALASLVCAALYRAEPLSGSPVNADEGLLETGLARLLQRQEIILERRTKKKKVVRVNVRPFILEAWIDKAEKDIIALEMLLKAGSSGGVSPFFILEQLEPKELFYTSPPAGWQVHRKSLYRCEEGKTKLLAEGL